MCRIGLGLAPNPDAGEQQWSTELHCEWREAAVSATTETEWEKNKQLGSEPHVLLLCLFPAPPWLTCILFTCPSLFVKPVCSPLSLSVLQVAITFPPPPVFCSPVLVHFWNILDVLPFSYWFLDLTFTCLHHNYPVLVFTKYFWTQTHF